MEDLGRLRHRVRQQPRVANAWVELSVAEYRLGLAADSMNSAFRAWCLDRALFHNLWSLAQHIGIAPSEGGALDPYVRLLGEANHWRKRGMNWLAASRLEEAAALRPEAPFAYVRLGMLRLLEGRLDEGRELIAAGVARGQHSVESSLLLSAGDYAGLPATARSIPWRVPAGLEVGQPKVVFASCDARYFVKFAQVLVGSYCEHTGDVHVVINIVNPDAEAQALATKMTKHYAGRLTLLAMRCDLGHLDDTGRRTFYASSRFLLLPDLLRRLQRPVLVLDVDSILLANDRPLWKILDSCDVGCVTVDEETHNLWNIYWAGLVVLGPTAATQDFADSLGGFLYRCYRENRLLWFLDQLAMFAILRIHPDSKLRFGKIARDIHWQEFGVSPAGVIQTPPPKGTLFWTFTASHANRAAMINDTRFSRYRIA